MQLMNSHRDDVTIDGKSGVLLMRDSKQALVKFDNGATAWFASDQVPATQGELEIAAASQERVVMLRTAGVLVPAERRA